MSSDHRDHPDYGNGRHIFEGPLGPAKRAITTASTVVGVTLATGNPVFGLIAGGYVHAKQINDKARNQEIDRTVRNYRREQRGR